MPAKSSEIQGSDKHIDIKTKEYDDAKKSKKKNGKRGEKTESKRSLKKDVVDDMTGESTETNAHHKHVDIKTKEKDDAKKSNKKNGKKRANTAKSSDEHIDGGMRPSVQQCDGSGAKVEDNKVMNETEGKKSY